MLYINKVLTNIQVAHIGKTMDYFPNITVNRQIVGLSTE